MKKTDLVEAVCKTGGTKKEAARVVDAFFGCIKEALGQGEEVKISEFGSFALRDKKMRMGRNPRTGAPLPIAARRVVTFKTSDAIRARLNEARSL